MEGFPGGPLVKSPPGKAENISSIPGLNIPHTVEQLSPCATIAEPALQSPKATATAPMRLNYCNQSRAQYIQAYYF